MDSSKEVWLWGEPGFERRFLAPKFDVPSDCSVELSPLGNQFLTDIFEAYDKVNLKKLIIWKIPAEIKI